MLKGVLISGGDCEFFSEMMINDVGFSEEFLGFEGFFVFVGNGS